MRDGEIGFWGEWEASSKVVRIKRPKHRGPEWIHETLADFSTAAGDRQNTDPFVFGGFFYTGCKQEKRRRAGGWTPTAMQRLARGSVILFGSSMADNFVIDTVFVVAGSRQHNHLDYETVLRDQMPAAYWDVTLRPWYAEDTASRSYRFYMGATIDNPVEGMFSFVPCLLFPQAADGFARPAIVLPDIVNPRSRQANRLNPQDNIGAVVPLWRSVVDQVLSQGSALGVSVSDVR